MNGGAARAPAGPAPRPATQGTESGLLRRCRALGLAMSAALLGACASAPPATENLALTASGRLAVRVDATAERPAQSLSAAFEWRGDGERGELTLLSPLGSRIAQARWTPQDAWLVTPEGQARFESLEALAERAFGERIPLAAWPDWLAGRPWPGAASAPLAAARCIAANRVASSPAKRSQLESAATSTSTS